MLPLDLKHQTEKDRDDGPLKHRQGWHGARCGIHGLGNQTPGEGGEEGVDCYLDEKPEKRVVHHGGGGPVVGGAWRFEG